MAQTSKYGFQFKKSLTPGLSNPATIEVILANSAGPLTIGDAVLYSGGYLNGASVDVAILGILVGFVTKSGENIFKTKESIGGTKSGDDTFTAASSNSTVAQVKGVVIVDDKALFQAFSDTALVAADIGTFFNGAVADGTYIDSLADAASGAYSAGTQQFQLIERVTTLSDGSASTTAGLFKIVRTQLIVDYTA